MLDPIQIPILYIKTKVIIWYFLRTKGQGEEDGGEGSAYLHSNATGLCFYL